MPKLHNSIWVFIAIAVIVLALGITLTAIVQRQPEQTQTIPVHQHQPEPAFTPPITKDIDETTPINIEPPVSSDKLQQTAPLPETPDQPPEPATTPKISLNNVIRAARTWGPTFTSWYGKDAPDFTLTDITGKVHKLSDYRGKDVMIIFWATWCGPCRVEVPHLIALRNRISRNNLAMLAISYKSQMPPETTEAVKTFLQENPRINYTVFSTDAATMPAPFNNISAIPCSFFIDSAGKIKLATAGVLTLGEIKAILQAQWP